MAVAVNGTSVGIDPALASATMTWSHTAPASGFLLVGVAWYNPIDSHASATFNTTALTERTYLTDGTGRRVSLLGLAAPASGAHNIVVTFPSSSTAALAFGISFTGVDQISPYYDTQTQSSASPTSPKNIAISTATGSYAVDVGFILPSTATAGVIQNAATSLMNAADAIGAYGQFVGGYKLNATQLGWAWTGTSSTFLQAAVSLRPDGLASGTGAIFGSRIFGGS